MEWVKGLQNAINYIEDNLDSDFDYSVIAQKAYCSEFNFMRVFSVLSGYTIAEYIRNRRLTVAGQELVSSDNKVIDIALKYGYDSPESFNRAFTKFHGFSPSAARKEGAKMRSISPLKLKISIEGGSDMNYRIVNSPQRHFIGFKRRFIGSPSERFKQEEDFFVHTRLQQYALQGLVNDCVTQYMLITNIDSEGYDLYIAAEYSEGTSWLNDTYYEHIASLNPEFNDLFERITVLETTYAVFETKHLKYPTTEHLNLRRQVISEWLPTSGYQIADGVEIAISHWYMDNKDQRYIELWLPIESK